MVGVNRCRESTRAYCSMASFGHTPVGSCTALVYGYLDVVCSVTLLSGTIRDCCQVGELRYIACHESSHFSKQTEVAVCTASKKPRPVVAKVRVSIMHSRLLREQHEWGPSL